MDLFKTLLLTGFLFSTIKALPQAIPHTDSINPLNVEVEASYPGGNTAWQTFIQKNLNPAIPAKNEAPLGKYPAIAEFIVDKDGSINTAKAITKFGYGMEEEMIRVILKSGKWNPAQQNGKAVKAYRRQPLTFMVTSADFSIGTSEPYTLFTNMDNIVTVTSRKLKPADIGINVTGAKVVPMSDGKFMIWISKPGRVTLEIVNSKKDDKEIGQASFEVKAK